MVWVAWFIVAMPILLVVLAWIRLVRLRQARQRHDREQLNFADTKCYTQGLINRDVQ